jgi:hypothetical protein
MCCIVFLIFLQRCDAYAKMEEERLNWVKYNQEKLRKDYEKGDFDYDENLDEGTSTRGPKIILPSSFVNGPRYQVASFQDAIAIAEKHGKPKYFITFTGLIFTVSHII